MQRFGRGHTFLCRYGKERRAKPDTSGRRSALVYVFVYPSGAAFFAGRVISEGGDAGKT